MWQCNSMILNRFFTSKNLSFQPKIITFCLFKSELHTFALTLLISPHLLLSKNTTVLTKTHFHAIFIHRASFFVKSTYINQPPDGIIYYFLQINDQRIVFLNFYRHADTYCILPLFLLIFSIWEISIQLLFVFFNIHLKVSVFFVKRKNEINE